VHTHTPELPVSKQIVERLVRLGTEVDVVTAVSNNAAAVIPQVQSIEILVP
jgi:hypothetical protein